MIGSYVCAMARATLTFYTEQRKLITFNGLNDIDGSPARYDIAAYDLHNACEHDGDPLSAAETKNPPGIAAGGPN